MTRRPEKVLVIAGYAPSLPNFRGPLLRRLVELGHEVVAVAPEQDPETEAKLAGLGVRYRAVPFRRTGLNPLHDLGSSLGLYRVIRQERPELVFAYTIKPVIFGSFAARAAGVRRIYAMVTGLGSIFTETDPRTRRLRRLVQVLYALALRLGRTAIFQNPDDRAVFTSRHLVPASRTRLVDGSGVDLTHYRQAPQPAGDLTFVLVGRLLRGKGIPEYVQAARLLASRGRARFVLVGPLDSNPSGIRREELEAWQAEGLVDYVGATDDVRPYLAACHVFVLPSAYGEGVPRSVLEALATGRAIITTDTPGCRETVAPGHNGFLVPPGDPAALAEAMAQFLDDPGLAGRMGKASLELARQKYDVTLVNKQMLEAFELS
ncbi:glycosyltransferase family 4 protein [Deinococcus sp. SDU3-2]|uniref:Glycosyltransferase family 4 protein n=1 Tax=Deinococcus terrestris TaxID=2651870 RepID=A0A7X1NYC8_9DEIO|nr:glycosyltransferase family 4 protein [Deinococcus terrestris]MPY67619.1 glycosyltransferase family 4 protein [Deinococcus terrestris]